MATQGLFRLCVGVLVVGGMFWLGGCPSWADEISMTGGGVQAIPTPASTTTPNAAAGQLQPIPATSPALPANVPNNAPVAQGSLPCAEDNECGETFCGVPLCSPPGRFWLRADYLLWWTSGTKLPPLVTTSPQGTPIAQAGVLGYPTTSILYGNQTVGDEGRSGVRVTMGTWLDSCHVWGLEFDYFMLGAWGSNYNSGQSTGDPILMRPFFNTKTDAQASEVVAYSNVAEGTIAAHADGNFYSAVRC